jgi:hypothetical protein
MGRDARADSHVGVRSVGPGVSDTGPTRTRVGPGFRGLQGVASDAGAPARVTSRGDARLDAMDGEAPVAHESIRAMRDARATLCGAASTADDARTERALRTLLGMAVASGFSRTTACAVASAALEEGFPKTRRRHALARAAQWSTRARTIFDALTRSPDGPPGDSRPAGSARESCRALRADAGD